MTETASVHNQYTEKSKFEVREKEETATFQQNTSTFQYRVQSSFEIKCCQLTLLSWVVIENKGVSKKSQRIAKGIPGK